MAADQADVVLAARTSEALDDATRRIIDKTGASVGSFTLDATSATAEVELIERYAERALDMLVITIGGSVRGEFVTHSDEAWND
jgi:short-subunit dehydrogenase